MSIPAVSIPRVAVRVVLIALVGCGDELSAPIAGEDEREIAPDRSAADAALDVSEPALESLFLGEDDDDWREALREDDVVRIEVGGAGRSVGFRITLASGRRGYFKPEQSFSGAHWYSEVAAHYLDRELGFGRVPPVVGRALYWPPLRNAARAAEDDRIDEVEVEDNTVRGAFIGWIEGAVPPIRLGRFWERWVRVEGAMPFSPYQRNAEYRALINNRLDPDDTELGRLGEAEAEAPLRRVRELSDLIVFDYLIGNVDRWGGEFTNVRLAGRNGPLIFLDNGAGFWIGSNRIHLMDRRLHALQRFRHQTVDALERFDIERFRRRLESDPLHPVLDEFQIRGVEERRLHVLEHMRHMRERFGERVFIE